MPCGIFLKTFVCAGNNRNSRIVFALTWVFLLCTVLLTTLWATGEIDAPIKGEAMEEGSRNANEFKAIGMGSAIFCSSLAHGILFTGHYCRLKRLDEEKSKTQQLQDSTGTVLALDGKSQEAGIYEQKPQQDNADSGDPDELSSKPKPISDEKTSENGNEGDHKSNPSPVQIVSSNQSQSRIRGRSRSRSKRQPMRREPNESSLRISEVETGKESVTELENKPTKAHASRIAKHSVSTRRTIPKHTTGSRQDSPKSDRKYVSGLPAFRKKKVRSRGESQEASSIIDHITRMTRSRKVISGLSWRSRGPSGETKTTQKVRDRINNKSKLTRQDTIYESDDDLSYVPHSQIV